MDTGGTWFGDPMQWAWFQPDAERVVPQGTASVNITIAWDDPGPQEWYGNPQLWVRKASDSEPKFVADVASGDTVEMVLTKEDADLPHQVLSSWLFWWVVSVPDDVRPVTYSGEVSLFVTAHRGLPIEAYPGHPDRWNNATEWLVLEAGDQQFYSGDGTSQEWSCMSGCPEVYSPNDGVIIPFDADRVEAVLTLADDTPFVMGLAYHGATSREFLYPEPAMEDGLTRHYVIPVGPDGDGPYAVQSMWEFAVVVEEPERDGWTYQGWDLSITVHRYADE